MVHKEMYVVVDPAYECSSWYMRCFAGLKAEASRAGLTVIRAASHMDVPENRGVQTCVLCCSDEHWAARVIRTLCARGIHCVLAGPQPDAFCGVSGAAIDRSQLVQDMVQYFVSNGRRRLACLGMIPWDVNDTIRVAAFHSAMRDAGLPSGEADVFSMERGIDDCAHRMLAAAGSYDGVLCVNDQAAVRLISLAAEAGIRVPEDLFISGSGNLLLGQLCRPTLTTTELDYYQMGRKTVDIWQYIERSPDTRAMTIAIEHRLIPRGSTAFLPEKPKSAFHADADTLRNAFADETSLAIESLEKCLFRCDVLDLRLIGGIMRGSSLEEIARNLFVSLGTVNYRIKKMYAIIGVSSRNKLQEALMRYLGNPDALDRMADAQQE